MRFLFGKREFTTKDGKDTKGTKEASFLSYVSLVSFVVFLLSLPAVVRAQEPNQAALVIQFDQDRVETLCIPFEGEAITGGELLARSGLDVIIDASRGMGITLCRVEDVGCTFPAQHCFCQCMGGGPCAYWNYYYRDAGSEDWVYSPLGAGLHKAVLGSVEAWVWGDGHTPPSADLTFEAICGVPAVAETAPTSQVTASPTAAASATLVTPEATPAATATSAATAPMTSAATSAATSTPAPAVAQAATPLPTALAPTATEVPNPAPATTASLSSYLPFALAVLALILIAVLARRRGR